MFFIMFVYRRLYGQTTSGIAATVKKNPIQASPDSTIVFQGGSRVIK